MTIIGAENLSGEEVALKLTEGYRLLSYEYCLSFVVVTLKRGSAVYLVAPGESDLGNRLLYSSLSLFIGPWGIPWGPIYTISTIFRNLNGGHDHSKQHIAHVMDEGSSGAQPPLVGTTVRDSETTPGLAIASLALGLATIVLGVFGLLTSIPAIICGHLALNQIKKNSSAKGRTMAMIGTILGYLGTIFYLILIISFLLVKKDSP